MSISEALTNRLLKGGASGIFIFIGVFLASEIVKHLWFDFPLNMYEPELVTEAWALSRGEITHGNYSEGPYSGLYAPLYQLFGALLFQVLPVSLITMRVISIFSLVGIAFLFHRWAPVVHRWSFPAWIFAVLMWHVPGVGFDMHGKPDSFAAFLAFWSVFLVRDIEKADSNGRLLISALIAALAVAAKQPMLLAAAVIGPALLFFHSWKRALMWGAAFGVFSGVVWTALRWICGENLFTNVFVIPGLYTMRLSVLSAVIVAQFRQPLVLVAVGCILLSLVRKQLKYKEALPYFTMLLTFPAGLLTAAKAGGMDNAMLPFWYASMLVVAMHAEALKTWLSNQATSIRSGFFFMVSIWAFGTAGINIPSVITGWGDVLQQQEAQIRLISTIKGTPGDVYVPMDNYLAIKAGKGVNLSEKSELDVQPYFGLPVDQKRTVLRAIESELVITHRWELWFKPDQLENQLSRNGFVVSETIPLDRYVTATLWKKNTP
jgi:hypothetical protein